jgi:hypothetical protein
MLRSVKSRVLGQKDYLLVGHSLAKYSLLMLMKSPLRIMLKYTISNRDTTQPQFFWIEKKMTLEF